MKWGQQLVAPDDNLRCDAVTTNPSVRCALIASQLRDGRQVCFRHARTPTVRYGNGNRFTAFGAMMAAALGDIEPPDVCASKSR